MRIAIVNLVSQTPPSKREAPRVRSNHQSVGVQFARALGARGHDVTVFMSEDYRPDVSDEGVPCVYVRTSMRKVFSPALIPFTPSLRRLLTQGRFDIVICSELFQWSSVFSAIAKRAGGFRLYVWQEMGAHQRIAGGLISKAYHASVGRFVISRADAFLPRAEQPGKFLASVGVPEAKIGPVVPNGADSSIFHPGGELTPEPLIACVGSLVPLKQPALAVEALPMILAVESRARLIIKGFGPLEEELRESVARLHLGDSVTFDTSRSTHTQMAELYRRAWVGVFPTNGEGASLAPVEMVMCGTPVVVAEKLYHSEVLRTCCGAEVTGFDVGDIAAAALRQIGRVRSGEWDAIGVAKLASDLYSCDSMADRLLQFDHEVAHREAS